MAMDLESKMGARIRRESAALHKDLMQLEPRARKRQLDAFDEAASLMISTVRKTIEQEEKVARA